MTATVVAHIFVEDWAVLYSIPNWLLTDNSPQYAKKIFNAFCARLGTKLNTTTAYHPQTHGKTEWYRKIILSRLRHYFNKHQNDWNTFAQTLAYVYDAQTHPTTKTTPF